MFHAINNIYDTVEKYRAFAPGFYRKKPQLSENFKQEPKQFAADFVTILDESSQAISDLIRVANKVKIDDREKERLQMEALFREKPDRVSPSKLDAAKETKKAQVVSNPTSASITGLAN